MYFLVILALVLQTAFSQLTANLRSTSTPTVVVLDIHNTNPYPVALLRYNLPLDPRFGGSNNFRVTLDGQPVPYVGAVVKYADPDLSEYVILSAQESVAVPVVLHNLYDFTKIGEYKVQFDHFVEDYAMDVDVASIPRKRIDFFPSEIVTSNEITITVTEPYPKQVSAPYPCSTGEYNTILAAADSLVDMINDAQREIDLGNTGANGDFVEWYGAFTNGRWSTAEETIRNIRTNNVVDYACDDLANVYAYVYPADPTLNSGIVSALFAAAGVLKSGRNHMNRIVALVVLGMVTGVAAVYGAIPEIDPASGASALALLAGSVVVIRGLRRK